MIRSRRILAEIQLFRLRIAVTGIFLVRCLLTKHSLFQANTPSKRWYIARFFLIWSTPTGYEKLARRFEPIINGEII